jgi:hypothetical protein
MPDEPRPHSWWQTLPGILTAVAAVLTAVTSLIVLLRSSDQPKVTPVTAPAAPAAIQQPIESSIRETTPPQPSISGLWRDNLGTEYQLVQNGNVFRFEAEGRSCTGSYFRSSGDGTVTGNTVQSTYQSTLPSRGSCSGTLSPDGVLITSTCTDSVCGSFVASAARQQ